MPLFPLCNSPIFLRKPYPREYGDLLTKFGRIATINDRGRHTTIEVEVDVGS